jgi:ABC-2 type transport system permease protein
VNRAGTFWKFRALAHVARSRMAMMAVYRGTRFLLLGITVLQIFVLRKVWESLYSARPGVLSIPLNDLMVYLTLTNLITWSFPTNTITRYLRDRIREGSVVFDLIRPVSFLPQMVAQMFGTLCSGLIIIAISLPLVVVVGRLSLPAGAGAGVRFLISMLCAYSIAGLLAIMLAMVAFWSMEINGMVTLYMLVSNFLSGALVPVSVFPATMRTVVHWLPFQATTYVPASIYVGSLRGQAAWEAIGIQLIWVALLAAMVATMWRRALDRVVVQGG